MLSFQPACIHAVGLKKTPNPDQNHFWPFRTFGELLDSNLMCIFLSASLDWTFSIFICSFFTLEPLNIVLLFYKNLNFFPMRYWYGESGLRERLMNFVLKYIYMQSFVLLILNWDSFCSITKWYKEDCQKHKENYVLLHFHCFHSTKTGEKISWYRKIESLN